MLLVELALCITNNRAIAFLLHCYLLLPSAEDNIFIEMYVDG